MTVVDSGKDNSSKPVEIKGVIKPNNEYQACITEADNWRKLEDLLPRSEKLDKALEQAKEFDEKILKSWFDFDPTEIEDSLRSLKFPSKEQKSPKEPMFATEVSMVVASKKQTRQIEEELRNGEIPKIPGEKEMGFIERYKLKHNRDLQEKKKNEVKKYCEEENAKLKSDIEQRAKELAQPLEDLNLEKQIGTEFNPDAPRIVLEMTQTLVEAQKNLERLEQYCEEMRNGNTGISIPDRIYEFKRKLKDSIENLEKVWLEQGTKILVKFSDLRGEAGKSLGSEQAYGDSRRLIFGNFYRLPTSDQEDALEEWCKKEKDFIKKYGKSFLQDSYTCSQREASVDLYLEIVKSLRVELKKKCEAIQKSKVCHMTLSHEEYAKSILQEGFLISAAGQMKLRNKSVTNSPMGGKVLLPEVTFAVNGAEKKYGRDAKDLIKRDNITQPINTENDEGRNLGVGFVFSFAAAVEGNSFFEETTTQGFSGPDELHIFNQNHDEKSNIDPNIQIDINKGFFIAPKARQRAWEIFLLTPKEDGGAGKDEAWIKKHVLFYPQHSNPDDFVRYGINIPKTEQGILVPKDKKAKLTNQQQTVQLYEWKTLNQENSSEPKELTPQETILEIQRLLGGELPSKSLFDKYQPQIDWYCKKEIMSSTLHGVSHEARVMIWQEILARLLIKEGISLDQEALRWAAATHDTQRMEATGSDLPHGDSAAEWVENNISSSMSPETLKKVVQINRGHVPQDSDETMTPELKVFKDADGLDRVRLGDLNPNMLRHQISRDLLIKAAQKLFDSTQNARSFDEVIEEAIKLGLISED